MSDSTEQDLWHVKLSEGCVVEMTLDEIDTAFNAGRIKASTSVLAPGDFRWATLGEAAGLDDEPAAAEPEPVPYSIAPYSLAPTAADVTPAPPTVNFDSEIDFASETSAAGVPRRRGVFGKILTVGMLFGVLVAGGVVGGAYAARPAEFKEKVASVRDRVAVAMGQGARAAAVAPPQMDPPPPVPETRQIPPPPPAAETAAAPAPAAEAAPAPETAAAASVDSLPDATSAKTTKTTKTKKRGKRTKRR